MTPEQQIIVQKIAIARKIEIKLYEGYSARYAFGKKTEAVILEAITDSEILIDDYAEMTGNRPYFKLDSLGKQFIMY